MVAPLPARLGVSAATVRCSATRSVVLLQALDALEDRLRDPWTRLQFVVARRARCRVPARDVCGHECAKPDAGHRRGDRGASPTRGDRPTALYVGRGRPSRARPPSATALSGVGDLSGLAPPSTRVFGERVIGQRNHHKQVRRASAPLLQRQGFVAPQPLDAAPRPHLGVGRAAYRARIDASTPQRSTWWTGSVCSGARRVRRGPDLEAAAACASASFAPWCVGRVQGRPPSLRARPSTLLPPSYESELSIKYVLRTDHKLARASLAHAPTRPPSERMRSSRRSGTRGSCAAASQRQSLLRAPRAPLVRALLRRRALRLRRRHLGRQPRRLARTRASSPADVHGDFPPPAGPRRRRRSQSRRGAAPRARRAFRPAATRSTAASPSASASSSSPTNSFASK